MRFRFRFTATFLVFGVAAFVVASLVISSNARQTAESDLVKSVRDDSAEKADLLSGAVSTYTSGTSIAGSPADSAVSTGFQSLVLSTLVENTDIVRLSLYKPDGDLLWSSVASAPLSANAGSDEFRAALSGSVGTGLARDVSYETSDGAILSGHLASTFIPLGEAAAGASPQILEVAREVTGELDSRVTGTRDSMMRTLLTTMGSAFAVFMVLVFGADMVINRSRQRVLVQEAIVEQSRMESERLEARNEQLQELNRERDRLLSMVSHELRTPLTSMLAFTEVLRRRQGGDNRESNLDHLSLMRKNGDHLNSLIDELLEVTDLHADEFGISKSQFMLDELVREFEESAVRIAQARNQRIRIDADSLDVEMYADRKRLLQLLMNLLSNASNYSPEHTTITLSAKQAGDRVMLTMTDQGEGIKEEDQQKLFTEFFRGNSEFARSSSGLGLGLSIVKAIVDGHKGKVSVRSQTDSGTEVTVLLPIEQAPAESEDASEAA